MDLPEIIEQLEKCNYECEGGPLNMNVAFIALKEIAEPKPENENQVKTYELPLFRIDDSDHDVGEPRWQELQIHNIMVSLVKGDPLKESELAFLKQQNTHIKFQQKEATKKQK